MTTIAVLRSITERGLPGAHLVAAVKAAGFEVRSDGPTHTITYDDLGNAYPVTMYAGECRLDDRWYGVATSTADRTDPEFVANAKLLVEVAAVHKAVEGDGPPAGQYSAMRG